MEPFSLVNILNQMNALPEFLKTVAMGRPVQKGQDINKMLGGRQYTQPAKEGERQFLGERLRPFFKPTAPKPQESLFQKTGRVMGNLVSPFHTLPQAVGQRARLVGGATRENLPQTFPKAYSFLQQYRDIKETGPSILEQRLLEGGKEDFEKAKEALPQMPEVKGVSTEREKAEKTFMEKLEAEMKKIGQKVGETFKGQQKIKEGWFESLGKKYKGYLNKQNYGYERQEDVDRVNKILKEQGVILPAMLDLDKIAPEDREFMAKAKEAGFSSMMGTMMATTAPVESSGGQSLLQQLHNAQKTGNKALEKQITDQIARRGAQQAGGSMQAGKDFQIKGLPSNQIRTSDGRILTFSSNITPTTVMQDVGGRPAYQAMLERASAGSDPTMMQKVLDAMPTGADKLMMQKQFQPIIQRLLGFGTGTGMASVRDLLQGTPLDLRNAF